jgi:hypothetical protein
VRTRCSHLGVKKSNTAASTSDLKTPKPFFSNLSIYSSLPIWSIPSRRIHGSGDEQNLYTEVVQLLKKDLKSNIDIEAIFSVIEGLRDLKERRA